MSTNNPGKQTVQAGRRRHTGEEPAGGRPRAEAPRRDTGTSRPSGGTSGSGTSGGGSYRPTIPSGGGLPIPLPRGKLGCAIIALLAICFIVYLVMQSSGGLVDTGYDQPEDVFETEVPQVAEIRPTSTKAPPRSTNTPRPTSAPGAVGNADQIWTIMLYQDADDKILEQDIYVDLNEAERVGSTDQVQIVAQVDRFRGAYSGDGNWTSTKRFYITRDNDLNQLGSQEVDDLGEVNMSSGATLAGFVEWAVENYPADKYVLILSDHGMGWPGGWSDPDPGGRGDPNIPLASRLGDELYLHEIDQTLASIIQETGIGMFEIIGMDACLMSHVEVYSALAPYARYAVASQETEPSLGWAYAGFLSALTQDPGMSGADLARSIVETYIQDDQRIVDDRARQEFLSQNSPRGGWFSITPEQLSQQLEKNVTLAAIDLAAFGDLQTALNDLSFALQEVNQKNVARARSYAQSFTSIFGSDVPASYIDLGHFAQLLNETAGNRNVSTAVNSLLSALQQTVIAEKHGPQKPAATGISIYFPNSQLYRNPITGAESYTLIADRFANQSLWDDFLAFHYTGNEFSYDSGASAIPGAGSRVQGPGRGQITATPLQLSSSSAAPGQPVTLSTDLTGSNIGYIYLFVGYYDEAANSIAVVDTDYLESSDTRELNGSYYPVWPETEFTLTFDWDPIVFAVSNGTDWVSALFNPMSYGAAWEEAIYTVDGIYTFADSGEQRFAKLLFSNGELRQVFGFTTQDASDPNGAGAPREINPQTGDSFTVLEKWLDLGPDGSVAKTSYQQGKTIVFGEQMFEWKELTAAVGRYIVGFLIEDMDGNINPVYAELNVR